jgi:hypothetical protein
LHAHFARSKRVDGKFVGPGGAPVTSSQALCSSLLEECFDVTQEIRALEDEVSPPLKPIYDRLMSMRTQLEGLVMTHRWTLRETDLWNYSQALREIDSMRVEGKFVDAEGNKPPGQFVLLYLLRRCYGLIYRLLSSSEPVSEELMPIVRVHMPACAVLASHHILGKQAVDGQEVPERSAQIRGVLQSARPVAGTYYPPPIPAHPVLAPLSHTCRCG